MREHENSGQLDRLAQDCAAELVGQLFRPLAHQLNNPIQAVLGAAELLDLALQRPRKLVHRAGELRGLTGQIREEALRIAAIIAQLHAFVGADPGPGPCSFDELWFEVHGLWSTVAEHQGIRSSADLRTDFMVAHNSAISRVLVLGWLEQIRGCAPARVTFAAQSGPDRLTLRARLEGGSAAPPSPGSRWAKLCEASSSQIAQEASSTELRLAGTPAASPA